jgi:hypothetical protein
MTDPSPIRRYRFDEKVRDYLERIGHHYFLNESSGLYEPHPRRAQQRDSATDRHDAPLQVNVQRDRWAVGIPAILSVLTLLLLIATVVYTRRQWLEANRGANASETAANAAQSAAVTANDTLKEVRTGQGAHDTHTLAEAAKTQAGASTISAKAAESAANTAKATLEAQSSPWLGIEKDDADFIVSRGFQSDGSMDVTVTIRLHNYGSAPALDVSVYVPRQTTGGKYSGAAFFHQSNVCTESEQAERDVQARQLYGVEHIIWPSDHRDFKRSINTTESPAAYFSGCISYRGHSDSFQHISFIYDIDAYRDPMDPTPTIPKVRGVTLVGLEPLEQRHQH